MSFNCGMSDRLKMFLSIIWSPSFSRRKCFVCSQVKHNRLLKRYTLILRHSVLAHSWRITPSKCQAIVFSQSAYYCSQWACSFSRADRSFIRENLPPSVVINVNGFPIEWHEVTRTNNIAFLFIKFKLNLKGTESNNMNQTGFKCFCVIVKRNSL